MKYSEFRDNKEYTEQYSRYWILTISLGDEVTVVAAQWEPSNAKWYGPKSYMDRDEIGYTNEIYATSGRNWLIEDIR